MMEVAQVLWIFLCITAASGSISFLTIGDWGVDPYEIFDTSRADQLRVRDRMEEYVALYGTDFMMTAGDNFYPDGVRTVDSPRWDDAWKLVYNTTNLKNLTWYPSLGNHDHEPDMRGYAEVNRTLVDSSWFLPYFYHDFYKVSDDIKVHFVVTDTELLTDPAYGYRQDHLDWLNNTLENAEQSDWTLVVGHHPYWTCGDSGPGNPFLNDNVLPMLKANNVDLSISGHDHNMQYIVANDSSKPEFAITGGGGKDLDRYEIVDCNGVHEQGYTDLLFERRHGFLSIDIEKTTLRGSFIADYLTNGTLTEVYSFVIQK